MNIFQIRFILIEFLIEIDTFSRFKKKKTSKNEKKWYFCIRSLITCMIRDNRQHKQKSKQYDFDRLCFWSYYTLLYIIEYHRNVYSQGLKVPANVDLTINLSPADIRKEGSGYDLPLAIGILAAHGKISGTMLGDYMMIGELGLDGKLKPVSGLLSVAIRARKEKFKGLIVPRENVREAAVVNHLDVYGMDSLADVIGFLNGSSYEPTFVDTRKEFYEQQSAFDLDFADVKVLYTNMTHEKYYLICAA